MPLDPRAKRLLDMLALSATPVETTAQRRDGFEKLIVMAERKGPDMSIENFQSDGPPLRLYRPHPQAKALMVFFHGGGLVAGSLDTHDNLCRKLAAASGVNILSVGYRRAPEAKFPAQIEDAIKALHWVSENAQRLSIDPTKIALGGDSAGALIAILALSQSKVHIAALLLLCPVLDLNYGQGSRQEFANGYLIDATTIARDMADCLGPQKFLPSAFDVAESTHLPPTIIHSAEYDPFHDEAFAFAKMLQAREIAVQHTSHEGMIHSFYMLGAFIPQAEKAIAAIGQELALALS